ncbi:hypothetical protein [Pimelobacter sp. 30-1]|uniref:hypothetical protein n=1 Tax=Pimelobacter sp. 30-1 TaxID=2004991 RepID=UPI001C044391|nr:hypothetical protein [Pimelobacter sp. 30-1]MBU2694172.1 hypothetical protein [Pimelobacter sp. 30-1]
MAMSRNARWEPTFPGERPSGWAAFFISSRGIRMLAEPAIEDACGVQALLDWLRGREALGSVDEASYVYLALGEGEVLAAGSGQGFGEPSGALPSTVGEIDRRAIGLLEGRLRRLR